MRSARAAARARSYRVIHRSAMALIGSGLRKWTFSRPRRSLLTRLAASSTSRCLLTDWRAMSSPAHSSRSVWPLRSLRRSSSRRRLGSASALKTSSIRCVAAARGEGQPSGCLFTIRSRMAACQRWSQPQMVPGWAGEAVRPGPGVGGDVVGVEDRAAVERLAAAADAGRQLVPQAQQGGDLGVQLGTPGVRELLPLGGGGRPVGRQVVHGRLDVGQPHPDALRAPDEGHPAQHVAGVAPLAAARAGRGHEAHPFVEAQRRGRDADAGSRFPDGRVPAAPGTPLT